MREDFCQMNKQTLTTQISETENQIEALQERLKTNNFKSSALCSLEQIKKTALMTLNELNQNLQELTALKDNYHTTGKGKEIS